MSRSVSRAHRAPEVAQGILRERQRGMWRAVAEGGRTLLRHLVNTWPLLKQGNQAVTSNRNASDLWLRAPTTTEVDSQREGEDFGLGTIGAAVTTHSELSAFLSYLRPGNLAFKPPDVLLDPAFHIGIGLILAKLQQSCLFNLAPACWV
jgi:hypothetical protein